MNTDLKHGETASRDILLGSLNDSDGRPRIDTEHLVQGQVVSFHHWRYREQTSPCPEVDSSERTRLTALKPQCSHPHRLESHMTLPTLCFHHSSPQSEHWKWHQEPGIQKGKTCSYKPSTAWFVIYHLRSHWYAHQAELLRRGDGEVSLNLSYCKVTGLWWSYQEDRRGQADL